MTLEEIHEHWSKDSVIKGSELGDESLKHSNLHHKYLKELSHARLSFDLVKVEYAQAELNVKDFLLNGPYEDQPERKLPYRGQILVKDLNSYLAADKELIAIRKKLTYAKEKVEVLLMILTNLSKRNFQINNHIKWKEFLAGK